MNAAAAVGTELEAEEPAFVDPLHHDGARAVAEEHQGRAVIQSRILDRTSPPTTRVFFDSPEASMLYPCAIAYMKPVQPASKS